MQTTYRLKANNLLFMLGLPHSTEVLVVGSALSKWGKAFANVKYCNKITDFNFDKNDFGLILLHTSGLKPKTDLIPYLKALKKNLDPKGSLFFFADNYYSFSKIKSLIKGQTAKNSSGIQAGCKYYQKALKSAGFSFFSNFLSMTELCSLEETVKKNNPLLEIPFYYHPVQKFFHLLGKYHYIHDEYLYICSNNSIETNNLFMIIANKLNAYLQYEQTSLSLERFDLRARGAMILFVKELRTGKKFIVRVVTDPGTNDIVKKNHLFIKKLYAEKTLPEDTKNKLPDTIDSFMYKGSNIYIESLIPGILAWKVNRKNIHDKIYSEAINFIFQFNNCTKHKTILTDEVLSKLFEKETTWLNTGNMVDPELRNHVLDVIRKIKEYLVNSELFLVTSHGDYGYGNILVNPKNGHITGVIDWDTGKEHEFPGVDLINLKIQLARAEGEQNFVDSLQAIVTSMLASGSVYGTRNYDKTFKTDNNYNKLICYITLIRFMSRASQYPKEFASEQNVFREALIYLINDVPL